MALPFTTSRNCDDAIFQFLTMVTVGITILSDVTSFGVVEICVIFFFRKSDEFMTDYMWSYSSDNLSENRNGLKLAIRISRKWYMRVLNPHSFKRV